MTHFRRVKELMDKNGLGDRLLTGGGIIPTKDQEKLQEAASKKSSGRVTIFGRSSSTSGNGTRRIPAE